MLKVISVNVNGIRSAAKKGFFDWLKNQKAGVICIQEVRAWVDQLDAPVFWPRNYHVCYRQASKKGYSGVAILSRRKPDRVIDHIGFEPFDSEGRYLQYDFGKLSIASLYLPSGSSGEVRQDFKFEVLEFFEHYLKKLRRRQWGYQDSFRVVNQKPHQYTWWSNRGQAWDNNVGWRIDYQVVTPGLKSKISRASIYKRKRFSDHAPLTIQYDIADK